MKSDATVIRELSKLHELIDSTEDLILRHFAYAIQIAVRWAREDVVGWPSLVEQARDEAEFLKREIK